MLAGRDGACYRYSNCGMAVVCSAGDKRASAHWLGMVSVLAIEKNHYKFLDADKKRNCPIELKSLG